MASATRAAITKSVLGCVLKELTGRAHRVTMSATTATAHNPAYAGQHSGPHGRVMLEAPELRLRRRTLRESWTLASDFASTKVSAGHNGATFTLRSRETRWLG